MSIFDEIDMTTGHNEIQVVEEKQTKVSLFDILKSLFSDRDFVLDEQSEKSYDNFMINRGLSMGMDTIYLADHMNSVSRFNLDKQQHFILINNMIRKTKRYNKWIKHATNKDLDVIKFYANCSDNRAAKILKLLKNHQFEALKTNMNNIIGTSKKK